MISPPPTQKLRRLAHGKLAESAEEQEWEDVEVQVKVEPTETQIPDASDRASIDSSGTQPSTPRRRRVQTRSQGRPVYIATSTPSARRAIYKQAKPSPAPTPPLPSQTIVSREELKTALRQGTRSSLSYTGDLLASFFFLLKKPLAFLLVIWVLAVLASLLSATVRAAFAPFCFLPGFSRTAICYNPAYPSPGRPEQAQHAEYPRMMEAQTKAFDQLLDEMVGGTTLSLDVKKTEMATKDLITVVKASDLRSKNLLADELVSFIGDARETGRGLQTLNARINSAVDRIIAVSDYALQTIEGNEDKAKSSGLVKYLWPFGGVSQRTESVDFLFEQSFSVLSVELERLILTAEKSQTSIYGLEEKLGTVHDILARENFAISAANDELLAELWTRLGGNRAQVARFATNLQLLKELGHYREAALSKVVAALQTLQALSADMEELRERASAPELTSNDIPMEVHARAIRAGVERLHEGRLRAKQLDESTPKQVREIEDT